MKTARLEDMVRGWFIGNFKPSLCETNAVEVAVRQYGKNDKEDRHYHKIATEYTVIISGRVRMFDQEFGPGSIVVVEPGEATAFESLTDDTVNVVVKIPGASSDKYLCE